MTSVSTGVDGCLLGNTSLFPQALVLASDSCGSAAQGQARLTCSWHFICNPIQPRLHPMPVQYAAATRVSYHRIKRLPEVETSLFSQTKLVVVTCLPTYWGCCNGLPPAGHIFFRVHCCYDYGVANSGFSLLLVIQRAVTGMERWPYVEAKKDFQSKRRKEAGNRSM
jgi:hypothetical protein